MKYFILSIVTGLAYILLLLAGAVHQFPVTEEDEFLSQRLFKSGIFILIASVLLLAYFAREKEERDFLLEKMYLYKALMQIVTVFFIFPVLIMNI